MNLFRAGGFILLLITGPRLAHAAGEPMAAVGVTREARRTAQSDVTAPPTRVDGRFADSSDSESPAGTSSGGVAMPVVSSRTYRMLAKVRPLLFWISKDDVGRCADPVARRRPRRIRARPVDRLRPAARAAANQSMNRWGYIAEQVRGSKARIIGVMKQSNERSAAEAESQLGKEASQGRYAFRAIQGTATDHEASAAVTTFRLARDFTYRDIDPLLTLVGDGRHGGSRRTVSLPNGTRPGFLLALSDLVKESVDGYGHHASAATAPSRRVVQYVYFGAIYDLTLTSSVRLKTASIDGRQRASSSEMPSRSKRTGTPQERGSRLPQSPPVPEAHDPDRRQPSTGAPP